MSHLKCYTLPSYMSLNAVMMAYIFEQKLTLFLQEVLVCGGEAMSIENVLKWASKVTLVNGYGPTEASVIAIANPNVSTQRDASNIGRALPSGHAWVVDPQDHNQMAPVGCVGELLLDGMQLPEHFLSLLSSIWGV